MKTPLGFEVAFRHAFPLKAILVRVRYGAPRIQAFAATQTTRKPSQTGPGPSDVRALSAPPYSRTCCTLVVPPSTTSMFSSSASQVHSESGRTLANLMALELIC